MRVCYIEPVGGLSGDMFLAALIDAGLPVETLNEMVTDLKLDHVHIEAERTSKCAIGATRISVHAHEHSHADGHQGHHHGRSAAELIGIVEASALVDEVKSRSVAIIRRIAEAEAKIHDSTPEEVHFHELGGLDTIVDVCGAVVGLRELGVERVYCAPLPLGHGFINCAHGRLPLPAPATAELLVGVPTVGVDIEGETVTPTGAALAACLADEFGRAPEMTARTIACGAGNSDFDPVPNIVRIWLGEEASVAEATDIAVIETNVDDMSPELAPVALQALLDAGAMDAWLTPIQMKKGRPALTISALAEQAEVDAVVDAMLRHTTSLGVRLSAWERRCLPRETRTVTTRFGEITVKLGLMDGEIVTASPEFEECREAADRAGVPVKQVFAAAIAALDGGS